MAPANQSRPALGTVLKEKDETPLRQNTISPLLEADSSHTGSDLVHTGRPGWFLWTSPCKSKYFLSHNLIMIHEILPDTPGSSSPPPSGPLCPSSSVWRCWNLSPWKGYQKSIIHAYTWYYYYKLDKVERRKKNILRKEKSFTTERDSLAGGGKWPGMEKEREQWEDGWPSRYYY